MIKTHPITIRVPVTDLADLVNYFRSECTLSTTVRLAIRDFCTNFREEQNLPPWTEEEALDFLERENKLKGGKKVKPVSINTNPNKT